MDRTISAEGNGLNSGTTLEVRSADCGNGSSDDDFAGASAGGKGSKHQKTATEPQPPHPRKACSVVQSQPPSSVPAATPAVVSTAAAASSVNGAAGVARAPATKPAGPPNPHAGTSAGAVLEWLLEFNRPVNAQMVADKFRSTMSKPQAEKALLSLSESGHAVLKEAGKAKVFWANQDHVDAPSEAELSALSNEIEAAAAERQAAEAEANQLKTAHKASAGHKSLSELRAEKSALEERVWKKQSDIAAKRSAGGDGDKPLTEKESQAAVESYSKMLRETKRRRGICYEMLSLVGEGNGKSRKQLMDEWALDTDEDSGFDINKFPILPPSALQKKTLPGSSTSARR